MIIMYRRNIYDNFKEITLADLSRMKKDRFDFFNELYTPTIELTKIDVEKGILYFTNTSNRY